MFKESIATFENIEKYSCVKYMYWTMPFLLKKSIIEKQF